MQIKGAIICKESKSRRYTYKFMLSRFMLQIVIFTNISICKVFSYQKFFLLFFFYYSKPYRSLVSNIFFYRDQKCNNFSKGIKYVSCINKGLPKAFFSKFKTSHMKWKNIFQGFKNFQIPTPTISFPSLQACFKSFEGIYFDINSLIFIQYILIWPIYLLFTEE